MRRFDLDAAILFSDILVVPHALGQAVRFEEGQGPVLDPVPGGFGALDRTGLLDRLAPVFETVTRVREALSPDKALIGFCGAPLDGRDLHDRRARHAGPDAGPHDGAAAPRSISGR